jgi:peptidoglycan/LPS O-acetylase OafA/YrhL
MVLVTAVIVWRAIDDRCHVYARFAGDPGSALRTDTRMDSIIWGAIGALIFPATAPLKSIRVGRFLPVATFAFIVAVNVLNAPALHSLVAIGYIVLVLACATWPQAPGVKWLNCPGVAFIGVMSYGLYIWQGLWLQTSMSFSGRHPGVAGLPWWFLDLALIAGCASVSFFLVEQPMRRLGYRLSGKFNSAPVLVSA